MAVAVMQKEKEGLGKRVMMMMRVALVVVHSSPMVLLFGSVHSGAWKNEIPL